MRIGIIQCRALMVALLAPATGIAQTKANVTVDPVYSRILATQPTYANPATRRLEVLTDIWGNIGLYHPVPSAERLKWDDVLVEAVKQLGAIHNDREFANMLNRVVFAPLHDPLMYATTSAHNDSALSFPQALASRSLAAGVEYISAVDRAYWLPAPSSGKANPRDFATPLRHVVDSLMQRGPLKTLVIDLRSTVRTAYRPGLPTTWLGMWLSHPVHTAQQAGVMRTTGEGMNQVQWVIAPADSLLPNGSPIEVPTVFIVNRTSYGAAERALDAVRSSRKDVAVVFEEGGPIPNLGYNGTQVYYPDSILLPHFHAFRISSDGALGTVVDARIPEGSLDANLSSISEQALSRRMSTAPRARFDFADRKVSDDTVSMGPLTREQRVAGLLKAWFWVGRFYAYPDDISGDWRQLPAAWLTRVEGATNDRAYYSILREISGLLNDTHAGVAHPLSLSPRGFVPPVFLAWMDNKLGVVRVDTADQALAIHPGDEIIAIDGKPIRQLETAMLPQWSVSHRDHRVPVRALVIGPRDDIMTFTVRSTNGVHDVRLARSRQLAAVYGKMFPSHGLFSILPGNVGYINLELADTKQSWDSAMHAVAGTRGLIIDDRSIDAAEAEVDWSQFVSEPAREMARLESISSWWNDYSPAVGFWGSEQWIVPQMKAGLTKYTRPMVLMIGNANVSHGEYLAMLFSNSHRGLTVGEPTNGTYGAKEGVTLPGGAVFTFTTGRALYPDGSKYHGIGVVPDIAAAPSLAGLRAGRDEVLETAQAAMRSLLSSKKTTH